MANFSFLILTIFLLGASIHGSAQNSSLHFERITAEQGLTSNRINDIVQDQSGFIWIATNNGLNRFDGFETKQYTKQVDDTCSLSHNSVLALFCDTNDQLWVLTINYLHRYNRKLDNFDRFLLSDKKESYRYENKGMITADQSGNIWIGTPTNGVFYFNCQTKVCQRILPEINSVSSVFADQNGMIWIGGANGQLTVFEIVSKKSRNLRISGQLRRPGNDDYIWKIWQDKSGKVILFTTTGFFQVDINTATFNEMTIWNNLVNSKDNEMRSICIDKETLWVGTQGRGMYLVDLNRNKSTRLQTISNNLNSLSNNSITSIIKDMSGVFWVATKDGLNKYDPHHGVVYTLPERAREC